MWNYGKGMAKFENNEIITSGEKREQGVSRFDNAGISEERDNHTLELY